MKKILIFLFAVSVLSACKRKSVKTDSPVTTEQTTTNKESNGKEQSATGSETAPILPSPPDWILQGNVYEVNLRQYTPEGTFEAFAKHLDRLKEMGVQTLWFMPLNPISKLDRKGTLGSYYAVADYATINPEFCSKQGLSDFEREQEWIRLVKTIHEKGMKVIIDWVPNHTGADHPWVKGKPDFYKKDSHGKPAIPFDWTDTRQLDYSNPLLQEVMINEMKKWIRSSDIDGFRVDVAWNVPGVFWKKCIPELKTLKKNIFMLAEGDSSYLMNSGFDAYYPWDLFKMMVKVAAGERPAFALDSIRNKYDTAYPIGSIPLYFTSNHDENSWNQSDYGRFPGAVHAPFAVFTQTMGGSVPLIYSGQEEPLLRKLAFFDKDPIQFGKYLRAPFYKQLLELRRTNPALSAMAAFKKIQAGDEKALYAYTREKDGKKILVLLNLSAKPQPVRFEDKNLLKEAWTVYMGMNHPLTETAWTLEPWGYVVYELK